MGIIRDALRQLNEELIKEDLEHWAKRNFGTIFGDGVEEKEFLKRIVDLAKLDPTIPEHLGAKDILSNQQGPYLNWILNIIKKGTSYEEIMASAHEYRDQLNIFNDLKRRNRLPSDKKDIMRFKSLDELMNMIMSLGGQDTETGEHSDFKQDVSNIREGLKKICRLEDRDIPQDIQRTEDVLKFIGGNSKWEIWKAENVFGTMLFDSWGNGAGWCVGGKLGNYYGADQLRQAKSYYDNYNANGTAHYYCFQQKDKNAERPNNKYLITLGENGSLPNNGGSGYQFNDSQNHTMSLNSNGELTNGGWDTTQDNQMEALAKFLEKEGLFEIVKNSEIGGVAAIKDVENRQRLEAGEPYDYIGGTIKNSFKDVINEIVFKDAEGKEHKVNAKDHPEFLNCISIIEMVNMENLINGEPFIYDGTELIIDDKFKTLIKEVIIPDSYDHKVDWKGEFFVGIKRRAFLGCVNMTKCTFSKNIMVIQKGAFRVNGPNEPYTDIELYTPRHKLCCTEDDKEWIRAHVTFTN